MLSIERTTSSNSDFIELVKALDIELAIRDGADHEFFAQFNKIDHLNHVVVAYWESKPAGCGAFKPYQDGVAEIKRMFVYPDFRNKGIASAVLNNLSIWSKECGFKKLILETGINQPEAIQLYQKNDFVRTANYGQYIGVALSLCFEKNLS
ncbi:MAG: GNAT family N-acetyltransferase [Bacteroidetes bacterium]|nr:GNAT family N-acetyltransferase [Bacteroidota bacterium]